MQHDKEHGLPLLVHLVRVDPDSSLSNLASYYAEAIVSGSVDERDLNLLTSIVNVYLNVNAELLHQLVQHAKKHQTMSASWLIRNIGDVLLKPWIRDRHEEEKVLSVRTALAMMV